jgi:hypothetical protein
MNNDTKVFPEERKKYHEKKKNKNDAIGIEVQYKALCDRMNSRYILAWGVPPIMIAAELSLLPALLRTGSFFSLGLLGATGTALGFLSYQLFCYHHSCKKFDEASLAALEERHAHYIAHGTHHRLLEAVPPHARIELSEHARCFITFPEGRQLHAEEAVHRWAEQLHAPLLWRHVLLATAVLPALVVIGRVGNAALRRTWKLHESKD